MHYFESQLRKKFYRISRRIGCPCRILATVCRSILFCKSILNISSILSINSEFDRMKTIFYCVQMYIDSTYRYGLQPKYLDLFYLLFQLLK